MAKKSGKKSVKKAAKKASKKSQPQGKKAGGKAKSSAAPSRVTSGSGASAAEIGAAVVAHFNAGKPDGPLWDKFWSKDVESIEGGACMAWRGRKALQEKSDWWMQTHTVHGASAEGPYVGATGFAIKFRIDVTDTTNGKRMQMEEIGVYTIKSGKIIREEFMGI
jgi:hypothetical protein